MPCLSTRSARAPRLAGLLAVLIAASACGRVTVAGNAMAPTLNDGEQVSVTVATGTLKRGDIVTLHYPKDESKIFIKRIVAVPGEKIESTNGVIAIDGRPIDEPYIVDTNRSHDTWGPTTMAAGEYFMLGDNRNNSSDSRSWGTVKRDAIIALITGR